MNNCCFTGRLVKDPEAKSFDSGNRCATFTLAVNRRFQKKTDFINFVAWEKTCDAVMKYFKKGLLVGITGELNQRAYDDPQGNKRYIYEVNVNDISFLEKREEPAEAPKPPKVDEEAYIQEENYRDTSDGEMLPFDIDGFGG